MLSSTKLILPLDMMAGSGESTVEVCSVCVKLACEKDAQRKLRASETERKKQGSYAVKNDERDG